MTTARDVQESLKKADKKKVEEVKVPSGGDLTVLDKFVAKFGPANTIEAVADVVEQAVQNMEGESKWDATVEKLRTMAQKAKRLPIPVQSKK